MFVCLLIGVSTSIKGGLFKAAIKASEQGFTTFQMFTRSGRSWKYKELTDEAITQFKEVTVTLNYPTVVSHLPYLPNFATSEIQMTIKTEESFLEEISRCQKLGISDLVLHIGSHKGNGVKDGIKSAINHFEKAISGELKVKISLETGAGTNNSVGSKFDEIGSILEELSDSQKFGVCFDTCHAFAAGYDFRSEAGADQVLDEFDSAIGLHKLFVFHANDSKGDLNCNSDRHEHIGLGKIGESGFKNLFNRTRLDLNNIPIILETPINEIRDDIGNMNAFRRILSLK